MLLFDPTWSNHGNHGGLMVASSELDAGKMLVNLGHIRLAGEVYSTIQTLEPLKMLRDWPPKGVWSFTISWTGFVKDLKWQNQNRNIHPNMPSAQTVLSSRRWYLAASCKQTQSQQMKPIPGPKYELLTFNCEHSLRQNTSVWFDLPWLSISTLAPYAAIAAFDWQVQICPGPNEQGKKTLTLSRLQGPKETNIVSVLMSIRKSSQSVSTVSCQGSETIPFLLTRKPPDDPWAMNTVDASCAKVGHSEKS